MKKSSFVAFASGFKSDIDVRARARALGAKLTKGRSRQMPQSRFYFRFQGT